LRLDAKTIALLKLDGKSDAIYFDDDMPGFGFRIRRSAGDRLRRSWVVQYKRAGASRRLLLGAAEVLSAEMARQAAKKILAKVALGEDPQADRLERRDKDRLRLRSVIDEYLAAKQDMVRPRTMVEVKRYLTDTSYFGPLHRIAVDVVGRKDVATRLVAITRERGSVTACRARTTLSAFYVWAMRSGIVESNPVIGTPQPKDNENRDRVLSDDELARVYGACGDDDFGRIVRLLILTGCRRSEIGGLRWSEIDQAHGTLTIPAERSKNGRRHQLPLTPLMQAALKDVPHMVSRDHLFGVHGATGFSRWVHCKRDLDQRSGVSEWVLHDIRRSVATRMADLGVQPHIIEQVLNHQSGHRSGVAGIYNRSSYEREVRAALALWEDHIRCLVEGGEREVIPIVPAAAT
jgi:integrase